jgi:hypothetical protein
MDKLQNGGGFGLDDGFLSIPVDVNRDSGAM